MAERLLRPDEPDGLPGRVGALVGPEGDLGRKAIETIRPRIPSSFAASFRCPEGDLGRKAIETFSGRCAKNLDLLHRPEGDLGRKAIETHSHGRFRLSSHGIRPEGDLGRKAIETSG